MKIGQTEDAQIDQLPILEDGAVFKFKVGGEVEWDRDTGLESLWAHRHGQSV